MLRFAILKRFFQFSKIFTRLVSLSIYTQSLNQSCEICKIRSIVMRLTFKIRKKHNKIWQSMIILEEIYVEQANIQHHEIYS